MMLDRETMQKIVNLPDDQLLIIIKKLAAESGVDISNLHIGKSQLDNIRRGLSVATNDDIAKAAEILKNFKGNKQ